MQIDFYKADGQGLITGGLEAGIQRSHCRGLASLSVGELRSCFRPLQAEAARDHMAPPGPLDKMRLLPMGREILGSSET